MSDKKDKDKERKEKEKEKRLLQDNVDWVESALDRKDGKYKLKTTDPALPATKKDDEKKKDDGKKKKK